jgi:hypothetical protein
VGRSGADSFLEHGLHRALRQNHLSQRDEFTAFPDMRTDRGIERAPFTRVASVDKAVLVSPGRAAFRDAQIFFV